MKYSLIVNQPKAIEIGLNLHQAIIFDFLSKMAAWAKPEEVKGEIYYWCARQIVCKELPLLSLKPDTVYRHFKHLVKCGLIDYIKVGKKDLIRLTDKAKFYHVGNRSEFDEKTDMELAATGTDSAMSEIDPNRYVGNKSEKPELLYRKQIRKNSDLDPTDHNNNIINKREGTPAPIPEDFKPSETTLVRLKKNGLKQLDKLELEEFICHYQGTGAIKSNWDAVYTKWVVTQRRQYDKKNNRTRTAPPAATPPPKITNFEHLTRETTEEERKQNAKRLKAFQEAAEKNGVKK